MSSPSPSSPYPAKKPTIEVTHRSGRAFSTSLLQTFLKPVGSSIIKPGRPQHAGSPELTPHDSVYKQCNVRQREVENIRIYDINARSAMTRKWLAEGNNPSNGEIEARQAAAYENRDPLSLDPTPSHTGEEIRSHDFARTHSSRGKHRQIYYFAGGGWQSPATKEHWKLCAHLAREGTEGTTTTTVSLVSYPLAPHTPASIALPMLIRLYYALLSPDHEDDTQYLPAHTSALEIILAGDSSGANIALSLTLHILTRDPRAPAPHSLFLISPPVDLRCRNPDMATVAKKDPVLTLALATANAQAWCGADISPEDPLVSPLLGDLSALRRRGVHVNGVVGSFDVLAPDAKLFREALARVGVRGRWLEWDRQMHCFPLAFSYGLAEGKEAVKWIVDVLEAPPVGAL